MPKHLVESEIIANFAADIKNDLIKRTTTIRRTQTAYGNTYADVMSYLYSMPLTPEVKENIGRRLVQEVTEPALAEAFSQIEQMSKLRKGWAGEGSYAVSPTVLKNLKQVLLISGNDDWTEWVISPDVNATVGLQSKSGQAVMSLGTSEFSYLTDRDGRERGESHVPFTAEAFLSIMRQIA